MLTYRTLTGPELTADNIARAATTALNARIDGTDDRLDLEPAHAARLALLDLGISSCDAIIQQADPLAVPSIVVECGSRGKMILTHFPEFNCYKANQLLRITPTWSACLPILISLVERGTYEGRSAAIDELTRMAKIADSVASED